MTSRVRNCSRHSSTVYRPHQLTDSLADMLSPRLSPRQLFPMDAGTDQGLAFTSPNWESLPREPVYQITSRRPKHPAGSFHYPELESLPPLANLKLYRVSDVAKWINGIRRYCQQPQGCGLNQGLRSRPNFSNSDSDSDSGLEKSTPTPTPTPAPTPTHISLFFTCRRAMF